MVENDRDELAVVNVIEDYVNAFKNADEAGLRAVFSSNAVMNGYVGERFVRGSPEIFISRTVSQPSLVDQGFDMKHQIENPRVTGNAASVIVREFNFGPQNFVDHMHLLKVSGEWKIVSKTFETF